MSIVKSLGRLKNNIFGGPGNTGFEKPPAFRTRIKLDENPVGILDDDPLRFGTYQFPKDMYANGQIGHYMIFYVNKMMATNYSYDSKATLAEKRYQKEVAVNQQLFGTPDFQGFAQKPKTKIVDIRGETKATQEYFERQSRKTKGISRSVSGEDLSQPDNRNRRLRSGLATRALEEGQTRRITDSVALYMPPNVKDSTVAEYQDTPTGLIGFAAQRGIDFVKLMAAKDYQAANEVLVGTGLSFAEEGFRRSGLAMAEALSGTEGGIETVNRIFGRADNPFLELFFTTMGLRTFTYNFQLMPRNEEETHEIQRIIQLFRFHMAPEMQDANSRYLTLPSEFDIHYMMVGKDGEGRENDYFSRIATCVLTQVYTDYTPNERLRTFEDGAPTQINLSLAFTETEMLTKEKINEGY